jgi:predicted transcriptional regulator
MMAGRRLNSGSGIIYYPIWLEALMCLASNQDKKMNKTDLSNKISITGSHMIHILKATTDLGLTEEKRTGRVVYITLTELGKSLGEINLEGKKILMERASKLINR